MDEDQIPDLDLDTLKASLYWIAVKCQQNIYELISDWNEYKNDEHNHIKNYIGYGIFGSPGPPESDDESVTDADGLFIYKQKNAKKIIENIYEKISTHGKQLSNGSVLCTIIHCCIYDEISIQNCNELQNLINVVPVFKVLKNVKEKDNIKYENWYIDLEGRVYKSWQAFLKNNELPKCTIVAPKNGIYQANPKELWSEKESLVWVEKFENAKSKTIKILDYASIAGTVGAAGVAIGAAFTPIGLGAAVAAAGVGFVSSLWSGGRATSQLVDRKIHDQSLKDLNAVPLWLGAIGSVSGLAAAGGTAALAKAVRTGAAISTGAQIAHDSLMVGNIIINGGGIVFNIHSLYKNYSENDEISYKDVFFLATHIFFVANSIWNVRFASSIIRNGQQTYLQEFEDSLRSNRHKKEFRRLLKNTESLMTDEIKKNELIIRSLNKIENKDDFFATLVQNRKLFASTETKLSFADGQLKINQDLLISPTEFASMSKDYIKKLINEPIQPLQTNVQTSTTTSKFNTSVLIPENLVRQSIVSLKTYSIHKLTQIQISNYEVCIKKFQNIWSELTNVPENSNIFLYLLECGIVITRGICDENFDEKILELATNFIWYLIKANFLKMGLQINQKYFGVLYGLTLNVYNNVKANKDEWIKLLNQHINSPNQNDNTTDNTAKVNLESYAQKKRKNVFEKYIKYYDLELINPIEFVRLPKELIRLTISETLDSTKSNINNKSCVLETSIKNVFNNELKEFFETHKIPLKFESKNLLEKLKDILYDIKNFDKKDIIFYKLIVITCNISQKIVQKNDLQEDIFVNLFKFIWFNILLNFAQMLPKTKITDDESENLIISLIITIYNQVLKDDDTWISAFYEFQYNNENLI